MARIRRIGKSKISRANRYVTLSEVEVAEEPTLSTRNRGFDDSKEVQRGYSLWATNDSVIFIPSRPPVEKLPCGLYEIESNHNIGIFFKRVAFSTENVIKFPDTNSEKVIDQIKTFWDKEKLFSEYELSFKRGILLYGPPGSGKTCTVKIVIEDVIKRGGIVLKFQQPELFSEGLRILRGIHPDIPIVVLMEDIDSILETFNESDVINILDGVDRVEKILFLATTNYPEKLGDRISNRPSRFDKRYFIDVPSIEERKLYFSKVIKSEDIKRLKIDIDKWAEDTEKMSLAHLKELVIAVIILGSSYDDTIEALKSMKEKIDTDGEKGNMGFVTE